MKIISDSITMAEIKQMAANYFVDMVKAVVDVDRRLLAVDAELHADLETLLLQQGSQQKYLWGINLYPDLPKNDFIEFDSLINVRPGEGNRSRGVEEESVRRQIETIIRQRIMP